MIRNIRIFVDDFLSPLVLLHLLDLFIIFIQRSHVPIGFFLHFCGALAIRPLQCDTNQLLYGVACLTTILPCIGPALILQAFKIAPIIGRTDNLAPLCKTLLLRLLMIFRHFITPIAIAGQYISDLLFRVVILISFLFRIVKSGIFSCVLSNALSCAGMLYHFGKIFAFSNIHSFSSPFKTVLYPN